MSPNSKAYRPCWIRAGVILNPGFFSNPTIFDGYDRNIWVTCLGKGTADKADIVGRTASATGLGDEDCCLVHVVIAGSIRQP